MKFVLRDMTDEEAVKYGADDVYACACLGAEYPAVTTDCRCVVRTGRKIIVYVDDNGIETPEPSVQSLTGRFTHLSRMQLYKIMGAVKFRNVYIDGGDDPVTRVHELVASRSMDELQFRDALVLLQILSEYDAARQIASAW